MQTYTGESDLVDQQTATVANSDELQNPAGQQIVTLTPLYILFGLIFAVSWVILWKQRILARPDSKEPPVKPPLSTEH